MVRRAEVDEEQVQDKRCAGEFFIDGTRPYGDLRQSVPNGDHCGKVDLLGGVSKAPEEVAVNGRVVFLLPAQRPKEGGHHRQRPLQEGVHRQNGGSH